MNIIVLTSSRADYGIYLPLLKKFKEDASFHAKIIAFGTHLSEKHGKTVDEIIRDGFEIAYQVKIPLEDDTPSGISKAMGETMIEFSKIWKREARQCDLIICLGDRYEMFAAVASAIPFIIPIAHIHGGETTLGAIDNKFRHSLTMMADIHFTSIEKYAQKVSQMIGTSNNVHTVGALSLDNLKEISLLTKKEFKDKFGFEIDQPVLVTLHPETIAYDENEKYAEELVAALAEIPGQIIITMPNADTMGNVIRKKFLDFSIDRQNVRLVESLGTRGYFTCMEECKFVMGNSSSGIIEAASFGKYVVNLGKRQEGRVTGSNVIHCKIEKNEILSCISKVTRWPKLDASNIYYNGGASEKIVSVLNSLK